MTSRAIRISVLTVLLPLFFALPLGAVEDGGSALTVQPGPAGNILSLDGVPFHRTAAVVGGERLIVVPGTGTRLVLWSETGSTGIRRRVLLRRPGR